MPVVSLVFFIIAGFLMWAGYAIWAMPFVISGFVLLSNITDLAERPYINNEEEDHGNDSNRKKTLLLDIRIEEKSIEGRIITGKYEGKSLKSMNEAALVGFHKDCEKYDLEGAIYIEAYLGKYFPNWKINKEKKEKGIGNNSSPENINDAYRWLGLEKGCSKDDLKRSYHDILKKSHPDNGGNEEYFKKIMEMYGVLSKHIK